jgi:hypothetical protein
MKLICNQIFKLGNPNPSRKLDEVDLQSNIKLGNPNPIRGAGGKKSKKIFGSHRLWTR